MTIVTRIWRSLAIFVIVASVGAVHAGEGVLGTFRDQQGILHETTSKAIQSISKIAKQNGFVTLWITYNYPFDVYLDPDTQQGEIDAQNAVIANGFEEALQPFIANGTAWHPKDGPFIRGPGCLLRVTHQAFHELVRDARLVQISYVSE